MVTARDLRQRAETFAVDVMKLCRELPSTPEARNTRDQLARLAKLGMVVEEADESPDVAGHGAAAGVG